MISKEIVLALVMKKGNYRQLTLVLLLFLSTIGLFAQQEFKPRQDITIKGDVLQIGNTILGLIDNPDSSLGPNGAYNGNRSNGAQFNFFTGALTISNDTGYIDIDQDDNTFSSSSADLANPSPVANCAEIIYAGLYWSANYYLAREQTPQDFSDNEISTSTATTTRTSFNPPFDFDGGTRTILTINNSDLRGIYAIRNSEFSSDVSDIQYSPASSNLVVAQPVNSCTLTNTGDLSGNIAVFRTGGSCSDREKVVSAQDAGAIGVIIVNDGGRLHRLTGGGTTITIPSVTIGDDDLSSGTGTGSEDLITELQAESNVVNATLSTMGDEYQTENLPASDVRKNGTADFQNILLGFGNPTVAGGVTYVQVQPQAGSVIIDIDGVPTPSHGGVIYDGYLNSASNPDFVDEDDTDGDGNFTEDAASDNVPYTCYANVTSIVQANGYGTYTVANMKATVGQTSGVSGAAGGWTMVVIYRDPSDAADSRFISVFDGFREIQGNSTGTVDLPISGFQTLPPGQDVDVRFGIASLEGDLGITGDDLLIIDPQIIEDGIPPPYDSDDDFTPLVNTVNGLDNFFNSSISFNEAITTNRIPASENTLGFDSDFFQLGNTGKNLLANDQTSTLFRLKTDRDTYQAFMTVFSVEEIVPEMLLLKQVFRAADTGTPIANESVGLGEQLVYRLTIENTGNEDYKAGEDVIVLDDLPANVDLLSIDGIDVEANPTGFLNTIPTIEYFVTGLGTAAAQIRFEIPPNLLTHSEPGAPGTGALDIDFTVRLVRECSALRDACSDRISNLASSTYRGDESDKPGSNDSSTTVNACGDLDGLATNFLANVPACELNQSTCGPVLTLTAGPGYNEYTWSGPNGFSAVTTINEVDVPQVTPPATRNGVYTVIKRDTTGVCMTLTEEITVTDFTAIEHPLKDNADSTDPDYQSFVTYFDVDTGGCSVPLAKISLCGDDRYTVDSERNPDEVLAIRWQVLNNDACRNRDDNCPAIDGTCAAIGNWTDIPTADKTTVLEFVDAGEYRLFIEVEGGCNRIFYFDINKNTYQPAVDITNMKCDNPGLIQVNNIPPGGTYRFVQLPQTTAAPTIAQVIASTNSTGTFSIPFPVADPPSAYPFTVYAVDTAFPNCLYQIDGTVQVFDPTFEITTFSPNCINNDNGNGVGRIFVEVEGGAPQYQYTITGGPDNINITTGNDEESNGNHTFPNLKPSATVPYTIVVISNRETDAVVCTRTFNNIILAPAPDFKAVASIIAPATCDTGAIVEVEVTEGPTGVTYLFADESGVFLPPPPAPAPQDSFQFTLPTTASPTDSFTFRVAYEDADGVSCIIETELSPGPELYVPIAIQSVTPTSPVCPGDLGRIAVVLNPTSDIAGRTFTFELLDNTNTVIATQTSADVPFPTPIPEPFVFSNVPIGTGYTVRVTHNNTTDPAGDSICPVEMGTYDITVATAVDFDLGPRRALSCNTGVAGNAQVVIDNFRGGAGTYEWSLSAGGPFNPIAATATEVVINVASAQNNFIVYFRDPLAVDCSINKSINIAPLLDLTSIEVQDERDSDCVNQTFTADISASPALSAADVGDSVTIAFTVTPAPETGPANFTISTTAGEEELVFRRGVAYTITAVRSDNNCSAMTTLERAETNKITILNAAQTSAASCNGEDDGAFSFTVDTALFPTFRYEIYDVNPLPDPIPATLTPIATGTSTTSTTLIDDSIVALEDGNYTIRVIDLSSGATAATSCFDDALVVITEPDPINFGIAVEQDCPTGNTVSVVTTGTGVTGGSGSGYTYTLYDGSPTAMPAGIPVGGVFDIDITASYTNVPAGSNYVIVVTDGTGSCDSAEQDVPAIVDLPVPAIEAGAVDYCLGSADGSDGTVSFEINLTATGTGEHFYTMTRDGIAIISSTSIGAVVAPDSFTTTPPPSLNQAGVYQFIVTDSKGCSSPPLDITIEEPIKLTATLVENIRCNATTGDPADTPRDGEILLTLADGYAPIAPATDYTIQVSTDDGVTYGATTISGPGPTFTFTTATPEVYRFRILDGRSCPGDSNPIELTAPVDPIFSATPVTLACATDTGEVIVTVNGPDDYTVTLNGETKPVSGTQVSFNGLVPSTVTPAVPYTYTITNTDKSCIYEDTVLVTAPEQITATLVSRDDVNCEVDPITGASSAVEGQITLAINGGNPDASDDASLLTYELTKDGAVTTAFPVSFPVGFLDRIQYQNLEPGNYSVRIIDGTTATCFIDFPFVIADAASELRVVFDPVASCAAGAILDLYVVGGTGPYEIEFESETGPISTPLNGLVIPPDPAFPPPGAFTNNHRTQPGELVFGKFYTFRIDDLGGSGCSFFFTTQVPNTDAPTVTVGTPEPEQCVGAEDGEIIFSVDNYSPDPTTITWEVFSSSDNVLQISGGPVAVAGVGTPVSINTNTFNFPAAGVNGLAPGQYYVRVTEAGARGCSTASDPFTIVAAEPLNLRPGTPVSGNCTEVSRVTMTTTGGNPFTSGTADGYRYILIGETAGAPDRPFASLLPIEFNLISNVIDLVGATMTGDGFYIAAIDANDCPVGYQRVEASIDLEPTIAFVPAATPPFVDQPCDYDDDYTFTVAGNSGVPILGIPGVDYIYEIRNLEDLSIPVAEFQDGGTHTFTVTSPGLYEVTVRDANDCPATTQIRVYGPLEFEAEFIGLPTCNASDGVIETRLTSGTVAGTLTYVLTGINGTPNPTTAVQAPAGTFTGVPPGEYVVTITDPDRGPAGCPFEAPVSIGAPVQPVLTPILPADSPIVSCVGATDATLEVEVTTATPQNPRVTYMYQIISGPVPPPATTPTPLQSSPEFPGLGAGTYRVRVVATLNNGTDLAPVLVECEAFEDYVIRNTTVVNFGLAPGDSFSCGAGNTVNTATINITGIGGGTPPYTVRVTEPAPSSVVRTIIVPTPVTDPFEIDAPVIEGGLYSIEVIDSNDCPVTAQTINVDGLPTLTNAEAIQDTAATCISEEVVTVTVTGGTGEYSFEAFDSSGSIGVTTPGVGIFSADITLTGGGADDVFDFVITDVNTGCTIPTSYTIPKFDLLEIRVDEATPETCFEANEGKAELYVLGYSGRFDYIIRDNTGATIYSSATETTTLTTTDTDLTTEDGPFIVPPTTATVTGLGVGNYTIQVIELDTPTCQSEEEGFGIGGPTNDFTVILDPRNVQETCNPGLDLSFQASVTGGRGDITYLLVETGEINSTGLFSGLSTTQATPVVPATVPPTFTFTVTATDTDPAGTFVCTDDEVIIVRPPTDDVAIDPITPDAVSCFDDQNGGFNVSATGTNGPFRFSITPDGGTEGAILPVTEFRNLSPGFYTVTAYDELNCMATARVEIIEPADITATFTATLETCPDPTRDVTVTAAFDATTGVIIAGRTITTYVALDVGTDPLNPTIYQTNGTGIFNDLPVGEYVFYAEDNTGCRSDNTGGLSVIAIPQVEVTLDDRFAFVNCNGESNGVINSRATGGSGPYTYTLSTVSGTLTDGTPFTPIIQDVSEFRDLAPARYVYTVTTDRACSDAKEFTIINPPLFEPEFTPQNVTCNGLDNGFIRIDASGGTPPYSYAINNEAFLNDVSDGEIGFHIFEDLAPGTYEVIAQDALGCSEIRTYDITQPEQIMVSLDGAVTPETCFGDSDGEISIIITGGTPPFRTNITNNDADFVEGLFTYSNLPAGETTIYIIDANDCRTDFTETIEPGVILNAVLSNRLECPVIDLDGNVTQPPRYFIDFVLGDDSVTTDIVYTLTGVNGTPNPPNNFNMTGTFEVSPGDYQGEMLHADGCSETIEEIIEIEEYIPLEIPVAMVTNNPLDPNEYIIDNVVSGIRFDTSPFYTFQVGFIGLTGNEIPLNEVVYNIPVDGNIFRIRQTGFYAIRVIDANGCEVIGIQKLTYINIRIPNYFTPGVDTPGTPDDESYWYPRQILPPETIGDPFFFENMEVMVFDRYGRMLATFVGDQDGKGWNGLYQGKELPSGDYWFTITLNDIDNREFTGHFTLYR